MGRLTLNVLLSFAQFEREVTAERIRDKFAASKKKGMWMGGFVPLGYRVENESSSSMKRKPKPSAGCSNDIASLSLSLRSLPKRHRVATLEGRP